MTRVLHVTECYGGGVSRAINTAVRLSAEHEHHLLWHGADRPAPGFGFTSETRLRDGLAARVVQVRRVIEETQPDVVHAHSSWAGVFTRIWPVSAPVIYQPHCYKFDDPSVSAGVRRLYRLAEKMLSRRTQIVAVLSPHEERLAVSLNESLPTIFIPNAPSISRHPSDIASAGGRVIMVGRISPQKDPHFFAAVAAECAARDLDIGFSWIGDGNATAKAILEDAGVEVEGWLDGAALHHSLSTAGIYLHSARYEGFPLSVLDAAEFSLPIIARRIPALEGTALEQFDSVLEAADAVAALIESPAYRQTAVAGGRALLDTMNERTQADALRLLYSSFDRAALVR